MASATRSIGAVLKILAEDFPDISISKIRFLEGEGLISPERAPSGYRRYAEADIERLRYILDVQKNHYLPLKVIRENLAAIDAGADPASLTTPAPVPVPERTVEPETLLPRATVAPPPGAPKRPVHITRRELLRMSGLGESALAELERHALVVPKHGTAYYGRDALTVAVAARKLRAYGMDARHLRAIKQAAEREAALVDQAAAPHIRRGAASRQAVSDVMRLILITHGALLRSSIRS